MSTRILGVTVGTTIPKPNYDQTDATKGDFIKGDILNAIPTDTTLTEAGHVADAKAVGDALTNTQVAIDTIGAAVAYADPTDNSNITIDTIAQEGWLKDNNGDKFAPKTFISQVQTREGISLEDKLQSDLDAAKEDIIADVSIEVDSELDSTSTNPIQNATVAAELDTIKDAKADWNQNDETAIDYVKNRTHWVEEGESTGNVTYHHLDENFLPSTIARTSYVDEQVQAVKDDLLNGAGDAYDTLKELGDLIDDNHDAIDALETVAASKADANHKHNYYGVCTTAAGTAAKTVQIDGFELVTGAMVIVKFDNSNSASNPTLNVSGTGAKPMYRYGTTAISTGTTTTGWYADSIQMFVYDGTGWIRDYWNNTTYSNAGLGQGYTTCSTAETTLAKTATLSSYSLTTGGIVSVKFTNAVPANATLNIASNGAKPIYHRGAAITDGIIKAGDVATFIYSTNYHLISIDSWKDDIDALKAEMDTALEGKADSEHTHDVYETKEDAQVKYDTIVNAKADWAQNDENAIDYVKNRTHYSVIEYTPTKIVYEGEISTTGMLITSNDEVFNGLYKINIDGIEYICDTYMEEQPSLQTFYHYCLGDLTENYPFKIETWVRDLWGNDITYPFAFSFMDNETHLVKIEQVIKNTIYKQLDENFIPDTIARKTYIDDNFALKSDLENLDLSSYETKEDSQEKYDALNNAKADKTELNNYYTKTETDNLELITVADIDAICGGTIQYAEDVMF